jgi:hypothetical protein
MLLRHRLERVRARTLLALAVFLSSCSTCTSAGCVATLRAAFPEGLSEPVKVCVAQECFPVLPSAKAFEVTLVFESIDPTASQPTFARLRNGLRETNVLLKSERRFPNGSACPSECVAFNAVFPNDSKR